MSKTKTWLVTAGNNKPAVRLSLPSGMQDADWEALYKIVRKHARLKSSMESLWFRAWPLQPTRRNGAVYWHREYDGKIGDEITLLPAVDVSSKFIRALSAQMRIDTNATRVRVVQPSRMLDAEAVLGEFLLLRKDHGDKEA